MSEEKKQDLSHLLDDIKALMEFREEFKQNQDQKKPEVLVQQTKLQKDNEELQDKIKKLENLVKEQNLTINSLKLELAQNDLEHSKSKISLENELRNFQSKLEQTTAKNYFLNTSLNELELKIKTEIEYKDLNVHDIIIKNEIDILNEMLKFQHKANEVNKEGQSPMYTAINNFNINAVKVLKQNGGILGQTEKMENLIIEQIENLEFEKLNVLILLWDELNIKEIERINIIYQIIKRGNIEILRMFNENKLLQVKDKSLLHLSYSFQHQDMMRYILDHDLDQINTLNKENKTVFQIGVEKNDVQVLEFLIKRNLNINEIFIDNQKLMDYVFEQNKDKVLNCLLTHGGDINSIKIDVFDLLEMDQNKSKVINEVIKELVKTQEDYIKFKNPWEWTLIHFAAEYGHAEVVETFIKLKVDKNCKNKFNSTPLHLAASNGYLNVVKALIGNKALLDELDNSGSTALHYAASNNHLEVIKYLIENGAKKDIRNNDGKRPVEFLKDKYSFVELLKIKIV